jgi:hypothetical protein
MRFPTKTESRVCRRCGSAVDEAGDFSEDGDIADFWCDRCVDYVPTVIVPILTSPPLDDESA